MHIEHITLNLANAPIRNERLHGRDYLVAPMVMLVEGVLNGSNGPLYYPGDECKRAVPTWNMRPVVVYHPEINGQGVSACDPAILERQQVGMCLNTRWVGNKLRSEAWVERARAEAVDVRVLEALERNQMMEVSTGLFTENEDAAGEFNGKPYKAIARNHQPDHLALLPDKIGACSIADGAGLLQLNEAAATVGVNVNDLLAQQLDFVRRLVGNAMSHGEIRENLAGMLQKRYGGMGEIWIDDIYDKNLIYHANGKLFLLPYAKGKDGVELGTDAPTEVSRVIRYRTADGTLVGNAATDDTTPTPEPEMKKEDLVNGLIANKRTAWAEADRATLMTFNEDALAKMAPKDEEPAEETPEQKAAKAAPAPTGNAAAPAAPVTLDGYLASAPPQVQTLLRNALAAEEAVKAGLIATITANAANPFTPEYLATKDTQELRGLAALATAGQPAAAANPNPPMFNGAATPFGAPVANAASTEEAYVMPTMNFAAPAAKA